MVSICRYSLRQRQTARERQTSEQRFLSHVAPEPSPKEMVLAFLRQICAEDSSVNERNLAGTEMAPERCA